MLDRLPIAPKLLTLNKERPILQFEKEIGFAKVDHVDDTEVDRIAQCIAGRAIFLTGATGYLGKALVEKLLRSCGDLKKIYLLMRPKKGKSPEERLKELVDSVLFDKVREQHSLDWVISKVELIAGDVMEPQLGISPEDIEILRNEVSIVVHCAATVRFDEALCKAVFLNVRGTRYMLDLASTFKKLSVFWYVSTTYCHVHIDNLYEKPYDPPADPHGIIKMCEMMSDKDVADVEKCIMGNIPNSYSYTKSLAEALVVERFGKMPAGIIRPSIVIPPLREPIRGYTDNMNGPIGILLGAAKGVIRTMYIREEGYGDMVPLDFAVSGIIASTWRYLATDVEPMEMPIVHLSCAKEMKITWRELIEVGRWVVDKKVPVNGVVWYPGGSIKSNIILHWISMILFHWLPAILLDTLLVLFRQKPVLIRVQKRITKGLTVIGYYANGTWNFDNSNVIGMRKLMNNRERLTYPIEVFEFDPTDYFADCLMCARRIILKQTDDTLPAAKRHLRIKTPHHAGQIADCPKNFDLYKKRPKLQFEKEVGFAKVDHVDDTEVDRIAQSLAGRAIFLTGGTGFMGKVLVEKLLRSCGELKKIYLLVRPKKGKSPEKRLKEVMDDVLFDKVKEHHSLDWIASKVVLITGDVMEPQLGISPENIKILRNEVSIVVHCAATVRYDEPLRKAVFLNVRGTKYTLDLSSTFKHLSVFWYISTTYCHVHVDNLYEKPYDPPADPHKVIRLCELLGDKHMAAIEKRLMGNIPNSYSYTKSLAEALVVERFGKMPTGIIRPSIVIPTWREPIRGWADNVNGPIGLLIGAGKGVIRTMYIREDGYGDMIPVDFAASGILVATWRYLTTEFEPLDIPIVHLSSSNEIKITWGEVIEVSRWVINNKVPLNGVAWYPGGSMKSSLVMH